MYSCPTCRKPLFAGRTENEANSPTGEVLSVEQLARQISSRIDRQNTLGNTLPAGVFPNQTQNSAEGSPWRFTSILHTSNMITYSLKVEKSKFTKYMLKIVDFFFSLHFLDNEAKAVL